jgi:NitT/TauT family transport system substrate-binding protein
MRAQQAEGWTRRRFLGGLTLAGTAGLLGLHPRPVGAEPPPETTRLRVKQDPNLCEVPAQVAEELLRAEGFSEVQYVWALGPAATFEKMMAGEIDLALMTALSAMRRIEAGDPLVFLAGVHVGCFELFGHEHVRAIRDLKGKVVAVTYLGGVAHLLTAIMAASVGLDPQQDITWVAKSGRREAMQFFIDGKADAFMGFPPEPQELRARKIGQVVVNLTTDRPWSQYFCCLLMATRAFVRQYPAATKRALRAFLKANEVCALQPETTARLMVDRGYTDRYDLALEVVKEIPYGQWREYDAEDTVRFFALRLREVGMLKATPQQIIAQGTDWRFLNELKKELKG